MAVAPIYDESFCYNTPSADDRRLGASVLGVGHGFANVHRMIDCLVDAPLLFYCVAGSGTMLVGGEERQLIPGQMAYFGPHLKHTLYSHPEIGYEFWWILYEGSYAESLVEWAGFSSEHPIQTLGKQESVMAALQEIYNTVNEKSFFSNHEAASQLIALCIRLRRYINPLPILEDPAMTSMDLQAQTLDDLARHAGYSKSHFIRKFKQAIGCTPWAFLIMRKMDKARELLLDTRYSVNDVAHLLGFDDPNYFSRVFKKTTGVSPTQFRQSELKMR